MSGMVLMDAREVRLMIQKIALLEMQIEKIEAIARFKEEVSEGKST